MKAEEEHNAREEALFSEIVSLLQKEEKEEPKSAPQAPQGPDWKPVHEALNQLAARQRTLDAKFFSLTGRKP